MSIFFIRILERLLGGPQKIWETFFIYKNIFFETDKLLYFVYCNNINKIFHYYFNLIQI